MKEIPAGVTTALNLAKTRLRWRRLRRHVPIDDAVLPPAEGTPQDFLAVRRLHPALQLPPRAAQQILLLSAFGDMRGAEIAAVPGIPEGTLASRKHLAMARLKTPSPCLWITPGCDCIWCNRPCRRRARGPIGPTSTSAN